MATWKRLTRDAPEGPIDVNMEKVALIEREKNRSYTLLIFNFAREDSLYTMTVKETPDEINRLSAIAREVSFFRQGALLS
jgi:hypothetical protein